MEVATMLDPMRMPTIHRVNRVSSLARSSLVA